MADKKIISIDELKTFKEKEIARTNDLISEYQKAPVNSTTLLNSLSDAKIDQTYDDHVEVYIDGHGTNADGEDVVVTSTSADIVAATTTKAGIMSAADKNKLDKSIKDINYNMSNGAASLKMTKNDGTESSLGLPVAGSSVNGLMSIADKKKVDTIGLIKKGSYTVTYASQQNAAPLGNTTIPFMLTDCFIKVSSDYSTYFYYCTGYRPAGTSSPVCLNSTSSDAKKMTISITAGNPGSTEITNIPYIGNMTGTLSIYAFT